MWKKKFVVMALALLGTLTAGYMFFIDQMNAFSGTFSSDFLTRTGASISQSTTTVGNTEWEFIKETVINGENVYIMQPKGNLGVVSKLLMLLR